MPLKASIIVPFRGRRVLTRRCLEAVRKHTEGAFEVLAVDNASPAGDARKLRSWSRGWGKLRVIRNEKNLPFAQAVNAAMRRARGEVLIWLNNDAVVGERWLDGLFAPLAEGFAASGPMTDHMAPPEQFGPAGKGVVEADFLGGFCFALKREALEKIGFLDERFVWGWEDMDYCLRLRQAGLRLALVRSVFVRHDGSRTLSKMPPEERREGDLANRRLILDKWPESGRLGRDLRDLFRSTRARWHSYLPELSVILTEGSDAEVKRAGEQLGRMQARRSLEVLRRESGIPETAAYRLNRALRAAQGDRILISSAKTWTRAHRPERLLDFSRDFPSLGDKTRWALGFPRATAAACGNFDENLSLEYAVLDFIRRARKRKQSIFSTGLDPEGRRPAPKFSVLLPAGDDLPSADRTLASLESVCGPDSMEVLLILDRPSDSDRRKYARQSRRWPKLRPLFRPENPGSAAAFNEGLREARGEKIVLLAAGLTAARGCLEALDQAQRSLPNCGAAAPLSRGEAINGRALSLPRHAGPKELSQAGQAARLWVGREALAASSLATHCLLLPRSVTEHVGNLDENLSRHDALVDYLLRVLRAGFQIARAPKAVVIAGKSSTSSPASRARLLKKWAARDDLALWEGAARETSDALA